MYLVSPCHYFLLSCLATVIQDIKKDFEISNDLKCRVHYLWNSRYTLISDPNQTLQESGLFGNSQVAIN